MTSARLQVHIKAIRIVLWVAIAIAAIAYALLLGSSEDRKDLVSRSELPSLQDFGGAFRLTDQRGATVTDKDVAGSPQAVFFGFTNCPDVCPTTLFGLTQLMEQLGSDADRLRVLFVTVDPERDTVEQLGTYMSSFDPRITALTGDGPSIDQMVRNFKAYYRKVPTESSYTMDHTALVFLMGADGRLVSTLDMHEATDVQLAKLRRLLKSS